MRRTLILTALGATTLSIGLSLGAPLASADPARPGPTVTTTMMGSAGMNGGVNADDMNAMHTAMHAAMSDSVSADQLAACDSAHAGMNNGESSSVMPGSSGTHTAHHQGTQP